MSRNRSIHRMHHSYFYATNCGASCLWVKSSTGTMPKIFWTGLQSRFSAKIRFLMQTYIYLSYHIEIKRKRPMAETSWIGTPAKFIQAEKSRPKRPKFCYLHSCHALIIWIGLLSHSSAKRRVLARIYRKSEAIHTPLKM